MAKRIIAIVVLALILATLVATGAALAAQKRRAQTVNYIEPWSCMQLYNMYEDSCMSELYTLAHRYLSDKKYEAAIVRFSQILQFKEFTLVYSNRGAAYALKGDYKLARPDMAKALNMDPKRAESWFNLARVDLELRRYEEALDSANVAIDLKSDNPDFYDLRARIHTEMQQQKKAEADTRRSWDLREAEQATIIRERAMKQ